MLVSKNKEPIFNEEKHKYIDPEDGFVYRNVTSWLENFKPHFDFNAISQAVANRDGLDVEQVREDWTKKKVTSANFGTNLHKIFEQYYTTGKIIDKKFTNVIRDFDNLDLLDLKNRKILFEKRVYNRDLGIAGTSDIVSISKNNTFDIADFKTNKRFRFTGITKNDFYLLPPISHLPNCEYFIYSLQLSLYAMLFESMTGLTPGRLTVFWYYRNNSSDYSDLNGEWRVFELPYLKREILDCLDYEKA
jgi:hypothetical protein